MASKRPARPIVAGADGSGVQFAGKKRPGESTVGLPGLGAQDVDLRKGYGVPCHHDVQVVLERERHGVGQRKLQFAFVDQIFEAGRVFENRQRNRLLNVWLPEIGKDAGRLSVIGEKALRPRGGGLRIGDRLRHLRLNERRRGRDPCPQGKLEETLLLHKENFLKL